MGENMTIYELIAVCKSKHIIDPVKIASWIIHNDRYWKSQGYEYTKTTVDVVLRRSPITTF